jgi:phosphopantetheinyl transferase (holo-ACP synthase)
MIVGIGIDIVEVGRMKAFIERHEARLSHICAPCELAYSQGKKTPYLHLARGSWIAWFL